MSLVVVDNIRMRVNILRYMTTLLDIYLLLLLVLSFDTKTTLHVIFFYSYLAAVSSDLYGHMAKWPLLAFWDQLKQQIQ
jgi:hypothetical protein